MVFLRQMEIGNNRDQSIRKGILTDLLKENFEEVIQMLDIQYSKEAELRIIRQEGEAIGEARGKILGEEAKAMEISRNGISNGIRLETLKLLTGIDIHTLNQIRP